MARGDFFTSQGQSILQEVFEFNKGIAVCAGIGSPAVHVLTAKGINDQVIKIIAYLFNKMGKIELFRYCTGILDAFF